MSRLGVSVPISFLTGGGATPFAPVQTSSPAPTTVSYTTKPQYAPRETFVTYYDPSRVFEDIKVVTDLRQSGTERGETQSGDNGILGPGSIAPPSGIAPGAVSVGAEKNPLIPIALIIGTFLLFGG